ncbi:MAG TPA: hypothetical protein VFM38_12740 [Candidatus Limnocylindrales bacterium]|nr:hypothetical protein [Candidatus Limnocylindrales bacterium]
MRKISKVTAGVVMLAAVACGRSDTDATKLSADLRKDLDAASSTSVELASAARGYKATEVVSAIEQKNGAEPVRRAVTKRPIPKKHVAPEPEVATTVSAAPEPEPTIEAPAPAAPTVAEAPAPAPTETATATAEPPVITRPRPIPISYPEGGSDVGRGGGSDIGTAIGVIGVIVRGGNGGIDHCDPRTDGRRGRDGTNGHPAAGGGFGGIMGGTVPRPTFPGRRGSIFRGQR